MPPKRRSTTKKEPATGPSGNQQPTVSSSVPHADPATSVSDTTKPQFTPDVTIVEASINTVPVQIPTGRLDSLTRSDSSTRAATLGGEGSTAKPKLKYAPKSTIRKTKQEREELNALYTPLKQEIDLQDFGITRGGSSSRGARGRGDRGRGDRGRGRGRGGAGRGDAGRDGPSTASGPFAMGSVITGKAKVSIERSGAGRSGLGGYSFGKSSKKKVKKEGEEGYEEQISSSDSEGGPKIDVEYIQLISDSEEGEANDEGERKPRIHAGGFPVRIERREHVDRKLANEGTKKKPDEPSKDGISKGKAKEKDVQFLQEERKWKGVYEDTDSDPPIKAEPRDDDEVPKSPIKVKKQSRSPEDKRRKPRHTTDTRKAKTASATQEDMEEFERIEDDQMYMLREFGPALNRVAKKDESGDHLMTNLDDIPTQDNKTDKLFLFQFPPILPGLVDPEELKLEKDDDIEMTTQDRPGPSIKRNDSPEVKKRRSRTKSFNEEIPNIFPNLKAVMNNTLPSGTAGKLRVHKSGRLSMIWGGIEFEVSRGTDCEFLQDIVVMKQEAGYLDENGRPKGRAWGMGQVKGKFVVSPSISKLLIK